MRLLLVSSCHHPSQGGIGTAVWWFVHFAVRAGWRVELITRPGNSYPSGAVIHEVNTPDAGEDFVKEIPALRRLERIRPYRYGWWALAAARRMLEIRADFDAVEFVDSRAEGFVALTSGRVRERWRGVPMYIRAHAPMFLIEDLCGLDKTRFGRDLYHGWERAALDAADGVLCPSRLLFEALESRPSGAVVPPFVEPARELKPFPHKNLLALVGSVDANKGTDVWARSLNEVLHRHDDAKAILIGPDTFTAPDGGSMGKHVHALIEPRYQSRFTWIGAASYHNVQRVIRSAAMVVVPSRFESFSYVGAEAILAIRPAVFSNQVGITECVPAAPIVNYGNVESLAAAQDKALANPSAALTTAVHCRDQLLRACDPSALMKRTRDFLHSIRPRPRDFQDQDAIDAMDDFLKATATAARAGDTARLEAISSDVS